MRLAAGVALVACVVLILWEYASGLRPKSLDWGTLAIIAVLFVVALAAPESWSNKWFVPVANGALFVLMLGTILVGRPFAAEYGKESAPPEVWQSAAFRKATLGISLVWTAAVGAIFGGSLITALKPSTEAWSTWVVTAAAKLSPSSSSTRIQIRFPVRSRPPGARSTRLLSPTLTSCPSIAAGYL
jgi:hypothetical protein